MGKSFFENTEEQQGSLPALTGALLEITGIERSKTGERAKTPGCRMYVVELKVVEPKEYANSMLRDWITVGTAEDPLAKRPETWSRTEAGPGRLKRLLTRSGTPLSDDDEEWMEAAEGRQVIAPVSARPDDSGEMRNRPGLYYRPSDEDAPEIGEDKNAGKGGKPRAKGAAAAAKKARSGRSKDTEPEEESEEEPKKPPKKAPKDKEDDDEDEDPPPKTKMRARKKDDDEEEED